MPVPEIVHFKCAISSPGFFGSRFVISPSHTRLRGLDASEGYGIWLFAASTATEANVIGI